MPLNLLVVGYMLAFGAIMPVFWVLIVPFFIMYILRRKVGNVQMFVGLHWVLVLIVGFLFWQHDARWFVINFMVLASLFSGFLKTREEIHLEKAYSTTFILFHIGLFLITAFARVNADGIQLQLVLSVVFGQCLSVIYTHMDNVDYSMNVLLRLDDDQPSNYTQGIIASNNVLIGIFAAMVLVVGLIITLSAHLTRFIGWTSDLVVNLWRGFIERFTHTWDLVEEGGGWLHAEQQQAEGYGFAPGEGLMAMLYEEYGPPPEFDNYAFYEVWSRLMAFVGIMLGTIMLILIIWRFYKFFAARQKNPTDDDTLESVVALESNIMGDLLGLLPRFRPKIRNPIRRQYAKKVNRHIRAGIEITTQDTTDAIANKIRATENIDELTAKYEKIRYGRGNIL